MTDVKTSARMQVRVLVRGVPLGEGATFDLAGSSALVTAVVSQRSKKMVQWPGVEVELGDLEAIFWVEPADLPALRTRLNDEKRVVAIDAVSGCVD